MADEKKPTIKVDISKWQMGDRMDFIEKASSDDNSTIEFLIEKGVIAEWPFAGLPSDKEAWRALELEEYADVLRAVSEAGQERFRKRK